MLFVVTIIKVLIFYLFVMSRRLRCPKQDSLAMLFVTRPRCITLDEAMKIADFYLTDFPKKVEIIIWIVSKDVEKTWMYGSFYL